SNTIFAKSHKIILIPCTFPLDRSSLDRYKGINKNSEGNLKWLPISTPAPKQKQQPTHITLRLLVTVTATVSSSTISLQLSVGLLKTAKRLFTKLVQNIRAGNTGLARSNPNPPQYTYKGSLRRPFSFACVA